MARFASALVLGLLLGWGASQAISLGWWTLVPWGLAAVALGYRATRARAMMAGALYGFVLCFVFTLVGYGGAAPAFSRIPFFTALGLVGALCGSCWRCSARRSGRGGLTPPDIRGGHVTPARAAARSLGPERLHVRAPSSARRSGRSRRLGHRSDPTPPRSACLARAGSDGCAAPERRTARPRCSRSPPA